VGKSAILGVDELVQGQVQAFNTVNDMNAAQEQAANRILAISITTSDYTVPTTDFIRNRVFNVSGLTADRSITFPTAQNGNTTNREISVRNNSDYTLTVVGTGGTSIAIPRNSSRLIHVNGGTLRSIAEGGIPTGTPHTVSFFAAGLPTNNTEVLRYIFAERAIWDDEFANSRGTVGTAPSPGAIFVVYKNGTKVGYIRVTAGGTFAFVTDSTTVSWVEGDVLTVKYFANEIGTVTFNAVADTGDTITIDNGTDSPVTFTFGGGGGQVVPGASATDSAIALKAAIEASAIAATLFVERSSNVLTIWNLLTAGGGEITKSDADNDYTVVDFAIEGSSENYGVTFYGTRR
jgi:hypothetical protein